MRGLRLIAAALVMAGVCASAQTAIPDRSALETRLATLPLPPSRLPPLMVAALIAQADPAFRDRYAAGQLSTVTQSVAGFLRGDGRRPEAEARLAEERALMARLSADEMLALYANLAFFGRGAFGIEAGARAWFGKPAAALAPEEAAFLAALVPAPLALTRPGQDARLKVARDRVLARMQAAGALDPEARDRAAAAPLPVLR